MERFRTIIHLEPSADRISYSTPVLMIGSCFTENIGRYLEEYRFPVSVNPFGVLYNPASILSGLDMLLGKKVFTVEDLVEHQGLWHSFSHHGSFSDPDPQQCLEKINLHTREASAFLEKTRFLLISLGTARVYRLKQTGQIVSNCHKFPDRDFERVLLSPGEIGSAWSAMLEKLWSRAPGLTIIFTISPIRHWKDGAHGNQVSKSVLQLAVHQLMESYPAIHYFPSYELVMDELRDYRFYSDDMIHLNTQAISYLWERFTETYIDPEALPLMQEVHRITEACRHRPFRPDSKEYKDFVGKTLEQLQQLRIAFPFLDLDREEKILSGHLSGRD